MASKVWRRYWSVPMPSDTLATAMPPAMPMTSPTTATHTIMTMVASTRGTTRKRTGWIACASRASISSETTIVPISAAMLAPAKPVSTIALTSGPSSRKTATEMMSATRSRAP